MSSCDVWESEERQGGVILLREIEVEEVISIAVPDEVVEQVDQVPDLSGGLGSFFIYHGLQNQVKAAESRPYNFDFAFLA